MQCWRCDSEAIPGHSLCQACATLPQQRSSGSRDDSLLKARQALEERASSKKALDRNSKMSPIFLICFWTVIVLVGGFILTRGPIPVSMKGVEFKTSQGGKAEICKNKKGCVLVFLAPWCGSCQSHVAFLNELQNSLRYKDLSLQVIVGWSKKEELSSFAKQLSGTVLLDTDRTFKNRISFSSVPRWFVVDSDQTIIDSFFPSYYEGDTAIAQLKSIIDKNAPKLSALIH